MSDIARITAEINDGVYALKYVYLSARQLTDTEVYKLIDTLLAHPNAIRHLNLSDNHLSDAIGAKLAQFVAASSTIRILSLSFNRFTVKTYLAIAEALYTNTSLRKIDLFENRSEHHYERINQAFIKALRLNPNRSARSVWYVHALNTFPGLRYESEHLGPFSMLEYLAIADK